MQDRLRAAFRLGRPKVEALVREPIDRRLVAGEEEPAGGVGPVVFAIVPEHGLRIVLRVDRERHADEVGKRGEVGLEPRYLAAHLRTGGGTAREYEIGD